MTERWFWRTTPRKLVAMLDEKKRIDINNWKLQSHIMNGGDIDTGRTESKKEKLAGIDYPANVEDMAFMGG